MRSRAPQRGAALVDVLIAVVLVGIAVAALAGQVSSAVHAARQAAADGRRAELAQRLADRVRSGLEPADSGTMNASVGGAAHVGWFARRDGVAPGSVTFEARAAQGGAPLVLGAARPAP